jgi:hypothetical protein
MSRDQNAGRSRSMGGGQSKYFETSLTNHHSIQEEKKRSLKSGNACYI